MIDRRQGEDAALKALRRACEAAGGQNKWARSHNVSNAFVSRVLSKVRPMTHDIAAAIGFERVTVYKRIKSR